MALPSSFGTTLSTKLPGLRTASGGVCASSRFVLCAVSNMCPKKVTKCLFALCHFGLGRCHRNALLLDSRGTCIQAQRGGVY